MTETVTRGTVVVDVEQCKGCELCIPACPPGVLSMSEKTNLKGYRFPELVPGCTGCTACAIVCPDFVFQVHQYLEPLVEDLDDEGNGDGA